jgi:signal transduction histidine kinase
MHGPAVRLERRRRDPGFIAALAAMAFGGLALIGSIYDLLAGAGPSGAGMAVALAAAAVALAVAGAILRARFAGRRRALEREVFLASSLARVQGPEGFARTLGSVLRDGRSVFRARDVVVPVRDPVGGRAWLWTLPAGANPDTPAQSVELQAEEKEDWLFEAGAEVWEAERFGGAWRVLALDEAGRLGADGSRVPREALDKLRERLGARRLTVVGFGRGQDWEGRVVLVDADSERQREQSLRFARRFVREMGGVVQSRFLLGRLRSRIGALERARVARELHDGTIQSLVGLEMEVDVLRRRAAQDGLPIAGDLARVQGLLRGEVLELRDTMQRLRAIDIAPEQLIGFLDAAVARFGRDTGIHAVFDCAAGDVDLPARSCRQVGRIVQEALQNVRKHAGARNVVVRLSRVPSGWQLVVDDDGKGFPFEGTLNHAELDEERKGPYVIKERVRGLGGELTITSSASGARLEILVPREAP